jgi:hypothetical protein
MEKKTSDKLTVSKSHLFYTTIITVIFLGKSYMCCYMLCNRRL